MYGPTDGLSSLEDATMSATTLRRLAAGFLALAVAGLAAETRDLAWFLHYVTDLDRLPFFEEGVVSRQFSSYHRASRFDREKGVCVGMDTNGDAGHCLTVHAGTQAAAELAAFEVGTEAPRLPFGDLEWVLDPLERNHVFFLPAAGVTEAKTVPPENLVAAIAGPGCIVRLWSANPSGRIRFYFDGAATPLEFDFRGLFTGGVKEPDAEALARRGEWPFLRPFSFRREGDGLNLASDCYLPIPFARSCLVALTEPSFYQVGYKTFPAQTPVVTFALPLTPAQLAAYDEARTRLAGRGADPKPARPGAETLGLTTEVAPGQEVVVADLAGPRTIQAVHARLTSDERYAGSLLQLIGTFDDETYPCIHTPLVNFFGTGFALRDYLSYPLGCREGEGYCYFPMPFHARARLSLRNEGSLPAKVDWRIVQAPAPDLPADTLLFRCKYNREEVCRTFDYPFLRCQGRGRFVGASLCIDDAWRSWWGEGDEKIWVDGDRFPSFFGTGSEDFFGDAWGIRTLHEPFFACSLHEVTADHSWTSCYRWMVPDDVPFTQRFEATIENYSESIFGTRASEWDEDYVSVAYWYQAPGGRDFFETIPAGNRRPWGRVLAPPVIEAEEALPRDVVTAAKVVSDQGCAYELSRGTTLDLGARHAGDTVSLRGPELVATGPHLLVLHTVPGSEGLAPFTVAYAGSDLGSTPPDFGKAAAARVGFAMMPTGRSEFVLRFTGEGRLVLDCLQLVPARKLQEVYEAEYLSVMANSCPEPVRDIGMDWSAGRQLRIPATAPGETIDLAVAIPAGRWTVTLGQTRGPAYGDWTVSLSGGRPVPLPGYAATQAIRDGVRIGEVPAEHGYLRLRFTCTGKAEAATGHALGLDYVGWRPIVVEDAIEGETADLTDVRNGRVTDQLLGGRFSGGNHLWFHPERQDAGFTWLLPVAEDGTYELAIYFTRSWDYAIVRLALNDKVLGEFDTYAPQVEWAGPTALGAFALTKGPQRLRVDVAGRNPLSKGILVGIDCVTLRRK
jgi:hypothetical protein